MTTRLYYTDAHTLEFSARITEIAVTNGRSALILDQTYFYPTSGGQPHDTGTLAGAPVVDVTVREPDQAILHWLKRETLPDQLTAGARVNGRIDAARRRDHMQQHSGQHLLTQAFLRVTGADTVSFHLSDNTVTIDLDGGEPTPAQLDAVEALANAIVTENRPIRVHLLSPAEAMAMPVRKLPDRAQDKIRLVEIENFDLTACGGTHVAQTGGIGLVKLIKMEKRGDLWRVSFVCGERALRDYRQKHTIVTQLMADLTTGATDLTSAVHRLRVENKALQRALKAETAVRLRFEAERLLQNGTLVDGRIRVVTHVFANVDGGDLRTIAQALTEKSHVVAFLAATGEKSTYLFARSADVHGNMAELLRTVLRAHKAGGGGGGAQMAQGGGPASTAAACTALLQAAQTQWLTEQTAAADQA